MDTEFPGVVLKHLVQDSKNTNYYEYLSLKDNVDILKLIQLGLSFSDEHGNLPTFGPANTPCIWQFNFREFNIAHDIYANESVQLLAQSGIDFKRNNAMGIDCNEFAQLLMSSGIVLNADVRWLTFHCTYDFGYLLKLLTSQDLPPTVRGFYRLINMYFPVIYDVKHLSRYSNTLHGGLANFADLLQLPRIGISHQAASDSLLTLHVFNKLNKDPFFRASLRNGQGLLYNLHNV